MYLQALPMARERTWLYYHHEGAAFIETMYFWGLPNLNDFGWDNPSNELKSSWVRYHIQGGLEVVMQMLDSYDFTQDVGFARHSLVPFADAIITYYDQHWGRGSNGKVTLSPVQSLETYQRDAVNPTPDLAGLNAILPRLLALPTKVTSQEQRNRWAKLLQDLPVIPSGKTSKGKIPPGGKGDEDGAPIILPAEKYTQPGNSENPELYVAFPYRLYGVGKTNLDLARITYRARLFPQNTCWGQDGTQASILGLTGEAQKAVIREFTNYGDQRFIWFWKAGHDWIPDLDNGGSGMITLQQMLMQCYGKRILLLPAWPKEWTADFKLHAPYRTTVQGHVENGRLTSLQVSPKSRTKDIVSVPAMAGVQELSR
jgi:alpha-L-fucosidase 2